MGPGAGFDMGNDRTLEAQERQRREEKRKIFVGTFCQVVSELLVE